MVYSMELPLLERFRRKIADQQSLGFSDPELQDIYDEAGGNFNKAVLLAWEELASNASRFADYVQNETQVKKNQIFKNIIKDIIPLWQGKITKGNQVRIVGTSLVPTRRRDRPNTDPDYEDDAPLLWG